MKIFCFEIKKLFSSVTVWVFILVCLMVNILIINSSKDRYGDFVSAASKETGYVLDQSFYSKLSQLTAGDTEEEHHLERLKNETDEVTDIFEDYKIKEIGERYISLAGSSGIFEKIMLDKYSALQKVVDKKAEKDESLTVYFAGSSHYRHQFLFSTLMGWLFTEAVLVSVLLVLLSTGYENINQTEHVVYSTKTGRQIIRHKFAASVSAGLIAYALLALITFIVYFSVNQYAGIWKSNVSSVFNYRIDHIAGVGGRRPFVTWYSFSVLTYFLAMLGMGAGLVICFSIIAFEVGVLVRNSYLAFFIFLAANAASVVIPLQAPQTMVVGIGIKYFSMLTPVWLWLKHEIWFTDGDIDIIWMHFETLGLCISIAFLAVLCLLTLKYFRKRNLS